MAILPSGADIPQILADIRPGAEWGWKGGSHRDTENVDWRDSVQIEPTEQEYLDGLATVEADKAKGQATRVRQNSRHDQFVGLDPSTLAPPVVTLVVEEILVRLQALDVDGLILPTDEWGSGVLPLDIAP
jgi:hypothetical protein